MQPGSRLPTRAASIGKSSLLTRVVHTVRDRWPNWLVVQVNIQDYETDTLLDLRSFLSQLAEEAVYAAGGTPVPSDALSSSPFSIAVGFKRLFASRILQRYEGVLLAIDEVDHLVQPQGCARDFFVMLRAWNEAGKSHPTWKRLRILLCFCTEASMVPPNQRGSPLANVGLK